MKHILTSAFAALVLLVDAPQRFTGIGAQGMNSWDQGWNDAGAQVWGATKGGYSFLKQ